MPNTNPPGDSPAGASAAKHALRRIDAALARIEAALQNVAPNIAHCEATVAEAESAAALAQLRQRHGALRIATAGALAQIDTLIGAFDSAPRSDSRP